MGEPKGVADHPAKTEIESLWRQGFRSEAINGYLRDTGHPTIKRKTLNSYAWRNWNDAAVITAEVGGLDTVADVKDLIEEIQAAGLGTVAQITVGSKRYPGWRRDHPEDTAVSEDQESIVRSIRITPQAEMPFEPGRVADFNVVYLNREYEGKEQGWQLGVFLPDIHCGYWDNGDGSYTTIHDEAALDVAHQIMADAQAMYGIDWVVNAGDNIDFPALGKYVVPPALQNTTQMGIDRAATEAKIQRELAPDAWIKWCAGNHESRADRFLMERAAPLMALRRAGEDIPVLSIRSLCLLDQYGVEFIEPYPGGEVWVNDHLRFEHGSIYSSGAGATAAKQLRSGISVGFGHVHTNQLLYETRHTKHGPRTHFAGCPGVLARIDGVVPSTRTGVNSAGLQSGNRTEDWHQGIWIVWSQTDGRQLVALEPISIWGGWAMWRGRSYYATCDVNGKSLDG